MIWAADMDDRNGTSINNLGSDLSRKFSPFTTMMGWPLERTMDGVKRGLMLAMDSTNLDIDIT